MRSHINTWLVSLTLGALVAGCAKHTTTVVDSEGNKATISEGEGKITFETEEGKGELTYSDGKMTFTDDEGKVAQLNTTVTEEELGVPFYPNSKDGPGSSKMTNEGKTVVTSVRETADSPSKVIAFYEEKLGKPKGKVETGGHIYATWEKDKRSINVTTSLADGKTNIAVVVAQE